MSFAVVCWTQKNLAPLPVEQVEVLKIAKLAFVGSAEAGKACSLQFRQEIWQGKISSIHSKSPLILKEHYSQI